jgi:glycosyltransferase involved in cell wall biosynthesis
MKIQVFATHGTGGGDEARILALLQNLSPELIPFQRTSKSSKIRSFFRVLQSIRKGKPDLVVMEGSGIGGGLALLLARLFFKCRYVVSSGDAIAPFVAAQVPVLGSAFSLYEKLLCRYSAGFIGWTPYLSGRALTYGAPYAAVAAGWASYVLNQAQLEKARSKVRSELGIAPDTIVIGIAGSLAWNSRVGYCYGYELIQAVRNSSRKDIAVLIVGDGNGKSHLEKFAGNLVGKRVYFTGRVPHECVPEFLAAMDIGSLPQSTDGVGSFRYTIKLSEYLAAGLPIVTGQIPLAYDLDTGWIWRICGKAPWKTDYIGALTEWMNGLKHSDLTEKKLCVPTKISEFDQKLQISRISAFIAEIGKNFDEK